MMDMTSKEVPMPALPQYPTAEAFLPRKVTLPALKEAAKRCKGCDLYQAATQTVFGEAIRDSSWAPCVMATVHPSSLLRAPDEAARHAAIKAFEEDMRAVKKEMDQLKGRGKRAPQAARGKGKDVAWASRPSDGSSSSMRSGETPKPRKSARHAREV